ncbi:hypothetical protein JHK84_034011 [Glycine max]|nr:hypothetical protein JHK85_034389 [Glycine max]KAG5140243.1 hypothetical protein JHK84_034011 [Glycine max]
MLSSLEPSEPPALLENRHCRRSNPTEPTLSSLEENPTYTVATRVLKHSWVLKAQSFLREIRRSNSCMLSFLRCSCFIDDNNNTSSVAVLLIEVRGKLKVSCHFVRSHCHCRYLGSRLLGPPVEITSDKDPAWLTISLFCIKQVHNKLLTLLAIILEFGALVC